jgi:Uma2 family endonuclease
MATTTHQISWESFEKLPDSDGMHRELIEGELQILPPPKFGHSKVASNAAEALRPLRERLGGRIFLEAGYLLKQDRRTWIQPDVSFVRVERMRDTPDSGYLLGGPDLAIEVASPSESAADLNRKVELLLNAGSLAVWVLYPEQRGVRVFLPTGASFWKGIGDTLSLPELLAGWECPVALFFED